MTNEILLIGMAAGSVLAILAAFFIGSGRAKKALVTAKAHVAQLETEVEGLKKNQADAAEQVRTLELAQQKSTTEMAAISTRKAELEQSLQQANEKAELSLKDKHTAEKACESAQTELQQTAKQKQELQERWNEQLDELKNERALVSQLKNNAAELGSQTKAFEIQAQEAQQQLKETKETLTKRENKLEQVQARLESVNNELTELKTSLDEREAGHAKQLENFEQQKQTLQKVFENTANKIFDEKGKVFSEANKVSIDGMLKPFKDQIEGFQKRINDIHDESTKGTTTLNLEIKKVLDIGLKMSGEASNLTSALKGDSQKRGAWGEAQLERTLEMSGLIADAHYQKQTSFKDQEGKQKYTDYVINLPDKKHIIIDSKVSLVAYDRAVSAASPEEEVLALDEHVKSVKANIDDLAAKDYTNLIGMRSPSFVLMFIPIEPAYIDALKNKKDLFNYGYEKGIVLVSHTTLIPILRTVANLWMMERSNEEAREISERAGDIYNQVCVVAERLQKLGGSLGAVSNHYNNTVKAIAGKQGLHGKVERFNQLSSKVSKNMPDLQPAHIDFETERLALVVEPLNEPSELAAIDELEAGNEQSLALDDSSAMLEQEDAIDESD